MKAVAKAGPSAPNATDRSHDEAARTILAAAGFMFSLVGAVLAVGGYSSAIHGSAFHLLIGLGLIASGVLVARRHRVGVWIYMLVFAGTVGWALRNVEAGSILSLRLIGPLLLLLMIGVLLPLLCGWRPRQAFAVFAALVAATVGLGSLSLPNRPLAFLNAEVTQLLDARPNEALQ